MKKVMAVTAGFLVAFVPAGTAFAGVPGGNAWGNCQHNAAGGKTVLEGSRLKNDHGLGGFTRAQECKVVDGSSTDTGEPVGSLEPVVPVTPPPSESYL